VALSFSCTGEVAAAVAWIAGSKEVVATAAGVLVAVNWMDSVATPVALRGGVGVSMRTAGDRASVAAIGTVEGATVGADKAVAVGGKVARATTSLLSRDLSREVVAAAVAEKRSRRIG
jgi:hypothetical protein